MDSFRGEPAAEKKLNCYELNALDLNSDGQAQMADACRNRYGFAAALSSLGCSNESVEGCPRKVGQMIAAKSRVVPMVQKTGEVQARRTPGAAQMRTAADVVLDQDCLAIAEALSVKCKEGDIQSIKLLYELAEKAESAAQAEGAKKFRGMAMMLANSPPWKEPEKRESDIEKGASD